ncbi:ATP-binding protein [Litoribacillus peritrichatus]|uniref:ATP-binding protein n=1 Tax=Litoribacillus peritrichatus TaxID=718191 RepID=A0ABP7MW07_9GAMM
MFLKYGGRNFYCFKDDFEVDLRLNKNCPQDISKGKDFSKVMCIKGANAAGKTNILKALSFVCNFATNSFNSKPDDEIKVESFFQNQLPVFLFCEFRSNVNSDEYRYEITLSKKKVLIESLFLLNNGKKQRALFHREGNSIKELYSTYEEFKKIPQIRDNASLISIANQHEILCSLEAYWIFNTVITNVNHIGFKDLTPDNLHKYYFDNSKALDFVTNLLRRFDTGIHDLKIDTYTNNEGDEIYYPLFIYHVDDQEHSLRLHQQSSGTRRLYHLLGLVYLVVDLAHDTPYTPTFIADELDLHLHSKILPELTKIFEESNKAQLIFTCQNDQILDSMGKYRTTLINKEENESYSYRLDELPSDLLRNNRPITPHYTNGSIGGEPNIEG